MDQTENKEKSKQDLIKISRNEVEFFYENRPTSKPKHTRIGNRWNHTRLEENSILMRTRFS